MPVGTFTTSPVLAALHSIQNANKILHLPPKTHLIDACKILPEGVDPAGHFRYLEPCGIDTWNLTDKQVQGLFIGCSTQCLHATTEVPQHLQIGISSSASLCFEVPHLFAAILTVRTRRGAYCYIGTAYVFVYCLCVRTGRCPECGCAFRRRVFWCSGSMPNNCRNSTSVLLLPSGLVFLIYCTSALLCNEARG